MPTRSWLYSHRAEFPTKRENRVSFRVRRPLAKRGRRKSATKISVMTRYPSGLWRSSERRKQYVSMVYCDSFDIFHTNLCMCSRHFFYYDSTLWCDDICRFLRIFRLLTLSSFTLLRLTRFEISDFEWLCFHLCNYIVLFNTHIQWKQKNLITRLLTILARFFTCSNRHFQYWQTLKFSSIYYSYLLYLLYTSIYSLYIGIISFFSNK